MIYNKLVRDKIPEIIKADGKTPVYEVLNDEDYEKELDKKLVEEVNEYITAKTEKGKAEELGDIFEVLSSILVKKRITKRVFLHKDLKKEENGSFEKRIFLKEAIDVK